MLCNNSRGGGRAPGNVTVIVSLCFSFVFGLILRSSFVEPHCSNLCYVIIVEGERPPDNVTIIVSLCFSHVLCLILYGAFLEADYGTISNVMMGGTYFSRL